MKDPAAILNGLAPASLGAQIGADEARTGQQRA